MYPVAVFPSSSSIIWTQKDFENVAKSVMVWVDTENGASPVDAFGNWGSEISDIGKYEPNVIYQDDTSLSHADTGGNINALLKAGLLPIIDKSGTPYPYTNYDRKDHVDPNNIKLPR